MTIAAVMAGGLGGRLGGSKATIELGGRPLVSYPLEAVVAAGLDAVVVAKRDTMLPSLDVPVWVEPDEPVHPLCGIVAALERAAGPVLVVACDMPFVTAALVAHLAAREQPLVVPSSGARLHPLFARYDPGLLVRLRRALEERESLHAAVSTLEPALIGDDELQAFGDPGSLLFNVNTPEDLARAREMLAPSG